MKSIIQAIDRLRIKLAEMQPLKPEYQRLLDNKIRLEFNYNSNHLEGNTLSYGETKLLLIFDKTEGKHNLREYEEMKSHDVAFELIKECATDMDRPLSEMIIKNLHDVLLVRPFWKEAITPDGKPTRRLIEVGEYKKHSNSVLQQNGEIFHYTSPQETPAQMGDLIEWYKSENEKGELPIVALAAIMHYKFVRIHPFDDGNGRISRLLMNYVLIRHGLPPVIIKTSDKRNYLFALNQADTGDLDAFVEYIAQQLMWSLEISIKAAKGENIDELEDFEKKILMLKRKLGETPESKVKLKYSQEAIQHVITDTLIPLMQEWEKNLKAVEPLFLSREVGMSFENRSIGAEEFGEGFNAEIRSFFQVDLIDLLKNKQLIINSSFRGLKKVDNNVSMNGGKIKVNFYINAYEIRWLSEKQINKLYHEVLTEAETQQIASDLGNWFHKNIEEFIERHEGP